MSDGSQIPVQDEAPPVGPGTPAASGSGVKAFFATTAGRVLLIVLAVGALLVVCGIVAVIALGALGLNMFQQAVEQVPVSAPASGNAGAVATTMPVAPAVPAAENAEVFSPRDPFTAIIIPVEPSAVGSDDANTLTLIEIVTDNSVRKAVLTLGATTYVQAAGERLGGTPWQVVSIGNASAVMLYGDTQMTLTVGQGVVAK
jgi:hypothetical protein